MKTIKPENAVVVETPYEIDARLLYNKNNVQAIHLQINSGKSLEPHSLPVDVFFYILEGNPEILIGEEKKQVEPNTLIESSKNNLRCIYNNTEKIVRVLVVKNLVN